MKLRKYRIYAVAIALLCMLVLSACGNKDNSVPGRITEEHGSVADYAGWWQLTEDSEDSPYAYLFISPLNSNIQCYDESGAPVATAGISYSEQRALNGGALMVFLFADSEHEASPWNADGEAYLSVYDVGLYRRDLSAEFDTLFAKDYHFTLYNESDYDISSVALGISGGSVTDDMNVLTSVLKAGESVDVSGTIPGSMISNTKWTLYVTDTEGYESEFHDEFSLFDIIYTDIYWDSDAEIYYCEYHYGEGWAEPGSTTTAKPGGATTFSFAVYNQASRDFASIHMVPAGKTIDDGVNVLDSALAPGKSVVISSDSIPESMAAVTDWTLYITDTDGSTSRSYEEIDPFSVSYIDVRWGFNGYFCNLSDGNTRDLSLRPGKWFLNGIVAAGDCVEIYEDNTFSIFNSSGTAWHTDNIIVTVEKDCYFYGASSDRVHVGMEFHQKSALVNCEGVASFDLKSLVVCTIDDVIGMDVVYRQSVYIHESDIGTSETNDILQRAKLFGYYWKIEDGGKVEFASDGNLATGITYSRDSIKFGEWAYANGTLTITWEDGATEECKVDNVDDGFTIPSVGKIVGSNIFDDSEEW